MVNPGAFKGARKEFLLGEKEAYALAVDESYAADGIAVIWRRYFKRFPIDLPDDEDPTPEALAAVDDDTPDPEMQEPDQEKMSAEEYKTAMENFDLRVKCLVFKKAQIRRWMAYQYRKDHDLDPSQTGAYNPYRGLLCKLTGKPLDRPRLKSAANIWRKTAREEIEEKAKPIYAAAKDAPVPAGKKRDSLIAIRDRLARSMFAKLPAEEQDSWKQEAKAEHDKALTEWAAEINGPIPTDSVARQRCIQGLVQFTQPILDLISEATGWKVSMIAGGPEPAQGGQLNILSIHSGTTTGQVKMNFGRSERAKFRGAVVPVYGSFLRKCYTAEECHSRALPKEEGHIPVSELDIENETASWDSVSFTSPSPSPPPDPQPSTSKKSTPPSSKNSITSTAIKDRGRRETAANSSTSPTGPDTSSVQTSSSAEPVGSSTSNSAQTSLIGACTNVEDQDSEDGPFPVSMDMATPHPSPAPSRAPSPAPSAPPSRAPSPARSGAPSPAPMPPTPSLTQQKGDEAVSIGVVGPNDSAPTMALDPQVPPVPMEVDTGLNPPKTPLQGGSAKGAKGPAESAVEVEKKAGERGGRAKKRGRERDEQEKGEPAEVIQGEGHKKKQARTKTSSTPAATPPDSTPTPAIPPNAPAWFSDALVFLTNSELGTQWASVVGLWGRFEAMQGFTGTLYLSSTNRPVAVKDWIQRARSKTWRPHIGGKPDWRVSEGGEIVPSAEEGDWDCIRKAGVNGLLSVMAALLFWGTAVQGKGSEDGGWAEAVGDVDWVLLRLLATK